MGKVKTNFDFKTSWTFFFLVLKYSQSFIIQTCFPLLLFLEEKIKFVLLSTKECSFSLVNEPPSSAVLLWTYFFVHSVTLHNVARCWLTGMDISVACEHTLISFVWWNSLYWRQVWWKIKQLCKPAIAFMVINWHTCTKSVSVYFLILGVIKPSLQHFLMLLDK